MEVVGPLRFSIPYNTRIRFVCAGDLHWASRESAHDLWFQMFEENQDAYYIFTGDLLHSISLADKRFSTSYLHDKFTKVDSLVDLIVEEVDDFVFTMKRRLGSEWIQNHVIGAISGNHPFGLVKKGFGFDPHKLMCEKLGIRNLGYCCMMYLIFEIKDSGTKRSLSVFVHHGFGGGSRTEGGNITSLSRHANQYDARVFVYGHVHELDVKNLPPRITLRKGRPMYYVSENRLLILSGTFQKCLTRSYNPSYFELKGYPVRPLGYAYFDVCFDTKSINKKVIRELRIDGGTRCFA